MTGHGVVMDLPCDCPVDRLAMEFVHACTGLAEARERAARKDTPVHRAAVTEARDRIDRILDMFLEAGWSGR